MKFILFLLPITYLLILSPDFCSAQPYFDIINLHGLLSPENRLTNQDDNPSSIHYQNLQVGLPMKLKDDIIILNPFVERYQLRIQSTEPSKRSLYGVGFPITYLKQWKNKNWKTAFVFIARINSEMKALDNKQDQYGGAVLAIYKKSEKLKYKFGIYYNHEFFGPFIIPLLGIEWNLNDRTNLYGVLPGALNLEYKINSSFYCGINFKSITNSYRFNDSFYLKISDNHLKIYVDYYPFKRVAISFEAGHSAFRKFSIGDIHNHLSETTFKDAFLLRAGIAWRVRQDSKR